MDGLSVYQVAGLVGFASYMASYGALQFGLIRGDGVVYTLANLAAALLVLVSLSEAFNLSSALIQIAWIVISLAGLTRLALTERRDAVTLDLGDADDGDLHRAR